MWMNRVFVVCAIGGVGSVLFVLFGHIGSIFSYIPSVSLVALDVLSLLFYLCYVSGFVALGRKYSLPIMMYASIVWITATIVSSAYVYATPAITDTTFFDLAVVAAMAVSILVVGWQMLALKKRFGDYATWCGLLMLLSATGVPYLLGVTFGVGVDTALYVVAISIFVRAVQR